MPAAVLLLAPAAPLEGLTLALDSLAERNSCGCGYDSVSAGAALEAAFFRRNLFDVAPLPVLVVSPLTPLSLAAAVDADREVD